MTFHELEARLRERLKQMVRRGEISERQLALRTGYTQPHIHNVLKGARGVNAELADALLLCVQMSLDDLLQGEAEIVVGLAAGQVQVPLWRGQVGPRHRFPDEADPVGYRLFPPAFLARFVGPVLMQLAPEEDAMSPFIEPGDLVLVDRAEGPRQGPVFDFAYVLSLCGHGAVCRCQLVGSALVLLAENGRRSFRLPDHLALIKRNVLDVVRGRVVWTCREIRGEPPAGPAGGRP